MEGAGAAADRSGVLCLRDAGMGHPRHGRDPAQLSEAIRTEVAGAAHRALGAPAAENDTAGYLAAVSKAMGIGTREHLDLIDRGTLRALIAAIIRHENGLQPYDPDTIDLAIDLA